MSIGNLSSTGRGVIVTGGSRGIGRCIAERFIADGERVVTCGRGPRPHDLDSSIDWIQVDLTTLGEADRLVAQARARLGSVHVVVNNAGVQVEKTTIDSTDDDWERVIGVNCRGLFAMCRAVLPEMERHGGVIVNIGSISASVADPSMALYNASKAFVHGLTRSIAVDHGPSVRCNTVCPGWISTEMADSGFGQASDPAAARADAIARHPSQRLGSPADIAAMVAWLASAEADFVTGQSFTVDGGLTAASSLRPGLF